MDNKEVAIKLHEDRCSQCRLCYYICPFQAISLDAGSGQIRIDIEKCQVCGLCACICPSSAIESVYYNNKWLIQNIQVQLETSEAKTLVIMCRGSSPSSQGALDIIREQGVDKFIPLRVPCVGRLSPEFYLKALTIGIDKILAIQCDDNFCRYKEGSKVNIYKVMALKALLAQLGYSEELIKIIKNPARAVYDTDKCVGCDKCEFACPFEAIELLPVGTPQVTEVCKGCGACAVVCPHLAIQIRGFEYEASSQLAENFVAQTQERKAGDTSPVILVFCCQWAEFATLDGLKNNTMGENIFVSEIPCLTKLDPSQVVQALHSGFDGVLAFGCSADDCKLKEGRAVNEQNVSALKLILERLNLAGRFEVIYGSPRYIGDFNEKLQTFVERISTLAKISTG